MDPREGLAYQVETLLTNIGGRPCWKLEECDSPRLVVLLVILLVLVLVLLRLLMPLHVNVVS